MSKELNLKKLRKERFNRSFRMYLIDMFNRTSYPRMSRNTTIDKVISNYFTNYEGSPSEFTDIRSTYLDILNATDIQKYPRLNKIITLLMELDIKYTQDKLLPYGEECDSDMGKYLNDLLELVTSTSVKSGYVTQIMSYISRWDKHLKGLEGLDSKSRIWRNPYLESKKYFEIVFISTMGYIMSPKVVW